MKEFTAAVAQATEHTEAEPTWEFKVTGPRDGQERILRAHMATPGQVAVVMSAVGRHTSLPTKIAGTIDFFMAIMDEDDVSYLTDRLMDRDDPFEIKQVTDILFWLIEEWSGHPTQGSSGSSSSQVSTGPALTLVEQTTPSDSPSDGSSTSSTPTS